MCIFILGLSIAGLAVQQNAKSTISTYNFMLLGSSAASILLALVIHNKFHNFFMRLLFSMVGIYLLVTSILMINENENTKSQTVKILAYSNRGIAIALGLLLVIENMGRLSS